LALFGSVNLSAQRLRGRRRAGVQHGRAAERILNLDTLKKR